MKDAKNLVPILSKLVQLANKIIAELSKEETPIKKISASEIVEIVEKYFNIKTSKRTRQRRVVKARDVLSVCLRRYTDLTLKEIAGLNGSGDHTTVIASVKRGYKHKYELDKIFELIDEAATKK